jgi:hypothetical protein
MKPIFVTIIIIVSIINMSLGQKDSLENLNTTQSVNFILDEIKEKYIKYEGIEIEFTIEFNAIEEETITTKGKILLSGQKYRYEIENGDISVYNGNEEGEVYCYIKEYNEIETYENDAPPLIEVFDMNKYQEKYKLSIVEKTDVYEIKAISKDVDSYFYETIYSVSKENYDLKSVLYKDVDLYESMFVIEKIQNFTPSEKSFELNKK